MILRALENPASNRCVKTLTDVDVFEFRLSFTLLLLGRGKKMLVTWVWVH